MPSAVSSDPIPSPVLRLAVVEFETPAADVFKRYGTYGDIAIDMVRSTLASATGPPCSVTTAKIRMLEDDPWPDIADIDALLITGSKHTASNENSWKPSLLQYIRRAYYAGKPMTGICYGHQIIAKALGGGTGRNPHGWELSVQNVNLTIKGQRLFGTDSLNLYQVHRDAVIEVPPNVTIIGASARCDVQIMHEPGRILTFQGHPEFNKDLCESFMKERFRDGELDRALYEDAISGGERSHDGAFVGVICNFLRGVQLP